MLVPPANATSVPAGSKADSSGNREETSGALDFTLNRTLENSLRMYGPSRSDSPASPQTVTSQPRQPGPGVHNPDRFYQQVTKDAQDPCGLGRAQQEPSPAPQQGPRATCSEPSNPGSPPVQGQSQNSVPPPASPAPADTGQQLLPRPPRSSSASIVSTSSSQAAARSDQQWLQPPPPSDLAAYYYYRPLYDGYQSQYPSPYPPDPGTASLYYQVRSGSRTVEPRDRWSLSPESCSLAGFCCSVRKQPVGPVACTVVQSARSCTTAWGACPAPGTLAGSHCTPVCCVVQNPWLIFSTRAPACVAEEPSVSRPSGGLSAGPEL